MGSVALPSEAVASIRPFQAFVFQPSKGKANPFAQLKRAFEAASERAPLDNAWILKPSDGCKGEGIFILQRLAEILRFLREQATRDYYVIDS